MTSHTAALREAADAVTEIDRKAMDLDAFWERLRNLSDDDLRGHIEQSRAFRDQLEPWRVAIAYGALAMRAEA